MTQLSPVSSQCAAHRPLEEEQVELVQGQVMQREEARPNERVVGGDPAIDARRIWHVRPVAESKGIPASQARG